MGQFVDEFVEVFGRGVSGQVSRLLVCFRLAHNSVRHQQGGVLSGDNPTAYNPTDPIRLWIIQVGMSPFLHILSMLQLYSSL